MTGALKDHGRGNIVGHPKHQQFTILKVDSVVLLAKVNMVNLGQRLGDHDMSTEGPRTRKDRGES